MDFIENLPFCAEAQVRSRRQMEGVLARAQEGRDATLITSNGNKPTQSPPDPPPQGLADSPQYSGRNVPQ